MRGRRGSMRGALVAIGAACLVGCSGGGSSDVASLPGATAGVTATRPPIEISTPVVVTDGPWVSEAASTTTGSTTTQAPATTVAATTSTAVPGGFVGLSADGPWKLVDSAPGVDTPGLVYELMPKLWAFLPTEQAPDNGNLFVPQPQDIPIIEAYLQSRIVMYSALGQSPFDFNADGWNVFYVDGGSEYRSAFADRDAAGELLDRDAGVVLRPYVLGDSRTEVDAIVFDCTLDGAIWRAADGGLGAGSTPGVQPDGVAAAMTSSSEGWKLSVVSQQVEACV